MVLERCELGLGGSGARGLLLLLLLLLLVALLQVLQGGVRHAADAQQDREADSCALRS